MTLTRRISYKVLLGRMTPIKKAVKYAVVDAFTDTAFKGNPAAVCLLEEERDVQWMQSLAAEFNISETCYLTRVSSLESNSTNPRFNLRWFTPVAEVDLCGHATLAASFFCFTSDLVNGSTIEFSTLSGILTANKVLDTAEPGSQTSENGSSEHSFFIELNFPAIPSTDYNMETSSISEVLSRASMVDVRMTAAGDLFVVLPSSKDITDYQPDFEAINNLPVGRGLIISASAPTESGFDFYSRFFCPQFGINEDPVCGSAHCALAVYWSKKLGKCNLLAYAASPRSGIVKLQLDEQNNRVKLQGRAVTVMEGSIVV